jgi:hypothetical protein
MCGAAAFGLTFGDDRPTTRGIVSCWPHLRASGSDRPGARRSLAVRGLIVFALGLAVAYVVRAIFMWLVYGCIGLIAVSLCVWRALRRNGRR